MQPASAQTLLAMALLLAGLFQASALRAATTKEAGSEEATHGSTFFLQLGSASGTALFSASETQAVSTWTHLTRVPGNIQNKTNAGHGHGPAPKEPPTIEALIGSGSRVVTNGQIPLVVGHNTSWSRFADAWRGQVSGFPGDPVKSWRALSHEAFPYALDFRDPNRAWSSTDKAIFVVVYCAVCTTICIIVYLWEEIVRVAEGVSAALRDPETVEEKQGGATAATPPEVNVGPTPEYDKEGCVIDWFQEVVTKTPSAVALVVPTFSDAPSCTLTYKALGDAADELSLAFLRMGIERGSIVALILERSVGQVVAVFGALRAGVGWLPVPADAPEQRQRFFIEESGAAAVVGAQGDCAAARLAFEQAIACIRVPADGSLGALDIQPAPVATQTRGHPNDIHGDVALLVFTSGTTGNPKGIVYDQRHLSHGAWSFSEHCQMDSTSVALLKSPYFWAIVEWELFPALTRGGRLVVASAEGHKSPSYLAKTIEATEVSVLLITPQVLDLVLDIHEAEPHLQLLHQLKHIVTVGEPLGCTLANRCVRLLSAGLHNFYGASESSCTVFTVPPRGMDLALFPNKVPAGLPQPHSQVYVVSTSQSEPGNLQRVPTGEVGEICFGGVLAARYWKHEALTREKWVDDPVLGRIYKTGDLGRWREGVLEVIGRTDRQVKIRGVRVEPEEVEGVLRKYTGRCGGMASALQQVVVVPTKEPVELAAFVSARGGSQSAVSAEDLRTHCKANLASSYVPKFFIVLSSFPLLPNGKADLGMLRELASKHAEEEGEVVLDSLGQMKRISKSALLETAVIHRCYAFWMIGVLSDHFCRCAMDVDSHRSIRRFCTTLARQDVRPWTEILIRSLGNDQDMFGFIMVGAYQDSRPAGADGLSRVDFGFKDFYMFAVYLAAAMPLPQILKYVFKSDCWPIYWMGDPEPVSLWNGSYMQVTSHVGGHRWYLWMIILARLYMAICEKCRVPGWLQLILIIVPALLPVEFAGDICAAIPGHDSPFEYLAAWLFDASAGSCGAYYRWVQWYICIYVAAFHFIRPTTKWLSSVLPHGRTCGAFALSLSGLVGLVMAMYHYPNYALEGEQASTVWALLEISATIVQPSLFVYGMVYVPLNLQWWGNTTLGCYIFHFYFRDQFSMIIMNVSTSLAWDSTGMLLLITLLGLFALFTTVMGPVGHCILVLPKLLLTTDSELRAHWRSVMKQVQSWRRYPPGDGKKAAAAAA